MATPATSPVMVGRHRDLADLREAHLTTLSGAPRVVVVAGEAGIGKTRLLGEFVEGLDPEVVVARGQCVAMGSLGTPFAPVRGVLRDLVAAFGVATVLEAAGPAGHLLAALLPELATEGTPAGEVAQEQLHDIVGQLLVALSDEAPLVVLVEDAHWADVATVDLLRALVAGLRRGRVTALLSYRTEDVGRSHPMRPFLVELDRDRQVLRLELARLSTTEAAELAQLIRGERPDPRDLALLVERSEGVPFFVEELLGLESLEGGALPETLRELVLARYVRLDEQTQAALRLIAAGGVSVDHDLLVRVHDGDPSALDQALRAAIAAQLLTTDGTAYTFRHALTQEAVHEELLPGERARFHARYAAALEELPHLAASKAEVAHHWLAAHDLPRALTATVAAAQEAVATGAPAVGARLGERALELWPQVPDAAVLTGMEKADLFLATASSYDEGGDSRALAVLDEALAECPREDRRRYALLLHETFVVWHAHSRPGGRELAVQALDLLPAGGDDEDEAVRLRVQVGLGISLVIARDDRHDGMAVLEEAAALGRALLARDPAPEIAERARFELARALTNLGFTRSERGDLEGALAALDEAVQTSPEDPRTRMRDAERRALLLCGVGHFEEAAEVAAAGHALAREVGQERGWGLSIAQSGVIAMLALGRLTEAEQRLDRIRTAKPWGFVAAYEGALRAELHVIRDEPAAAAEVLADLKTLIDATAGNDVEDAMAMVVARASVALARGDLTAAWAALEPLRDGGTPPPGTSYRALVLAGRVVAELRRAGQAPEGVIPAEAEQTLRQAFERVTAWEIKSVWRALLEAELSGTDGAGTDVDAWQLAVEQTAVGTVPVSEHAHALLRLAEAQVLAGDRASAAETLVRLRELTSGHGLRRAGRLAAELAERAGLEPGRTGGPAHAVELTAREQQVLQLVAEGLTNRQIGERLFISDKTASVHVSAILRKLGATSRTEAAVRAAQLGLDLSEPEPAS
jgi:DNA-binding NarL/FixJ family response regulator